MKKLLALLCVFLITTFVVTSCGSKSKKISVCECLKDEGSHKQECDELGNSMSSSEMNEEISKCQ